MDVSEVESDNEMPTVFGEKQVTRPSVLVVVIDCAYHIQ